MTSMDKNGNEGFDFDINEQSENGRTAVRENAESYDIDDYAYGVLRSDGRPKTIGWSIASLVLGIASVMLCVCGGYVGLVCGVLAIIFAGVSRRNLSHFDTMTIIGLIFGIFGTVVGICVIAVGMVFGDSLIEYYERFFDYSTQPGKQL